MLKDKFLRGSAFLFAAMIVASMFGYLFQVSMGRMLSVEAFGEMNALMSLMILFGIPFGTLLNFFARETAIYSMTGGRDIIRSLHWFGHTRLCLVIIPIIFLLSFFTPDIGDYLNVSFDKILLIFGCVFMAGLVTVNTGIIQGMQYFRSLSFICAGASVFKFVFAVIFVWLGWGVYGALGGLLATNLTILGFSQYIILHTLPQKNNPFIFSFNKIYKYVGALFLANGFMGLMTQVDVVMVKHYFPPMEAGLYASASVIGKAVMYLPGTIVMALFPMVAANQAAGHSSTSILAKAVGMTLVLSGGGAFFLYFFSDFIVKFIFGERYLSAVPIMTVFGIAMLPMSLCLLFMNFLLAQSKTRFIGFMAVATILEIVGIHFCRENIQDVLYVIMGSGCAALCPMVFFVLRDKRNI